MYFQPWDLTPKQLRLLSTLARPKVALGLRKGDVVFTNEDHPNVTCTVGRVTTVYKEHCCTRLPWKSTKEKQLYLDTQMSKIYSRMGLLYVPKEDFDKFARLARLFGNMVHGSVLERFLYRPPNGIMIKRGLRSCFRNDEDRVVRYCTPSSVKITNSSLITRIESESDWEKAIERNGLVVIVCKSVWSQTCTKLSPTVAFLAGYYGKIYNNVWFYEADIDKVPSRMLDSAGVVAVPTLLFYRNGKVKNRIVSDDKDFIKKTLEWS